MTIDNKGEKGIFEMQDLCSIKKRHDILEGIKWDVTPQTVMEPRFQSRAEDVQKLREISGYMFYIETGCDEPAVMLMKIGKSDITTTAGKIDEVPRELIQRALDKPACPPACGMYAVSDDIKAWLKRELSP